MMLKRLKSKYQSLPILAKASIAYTIGNIVAKSVGIITVPLFTRVLSTSEMGVSAIYSSWYNILFAVVTLSLCSGSLSVAMVDYEGKRDEYESACLFLTTLSGLFTLILYLLFRPVVESFVMLDSSVFLVLISNLIFFPAIEFWLVRQRFEYKYKSIFFVTVSLSLVSAIISIIIVLVLRNCGDVNLGNVKVISQNGVALLFALFFYILIFLKGKTFVDYHIWKYALKISVPLIVHTLAKSILDTSDRIMISNICGQSDAGIYGTIYNFSLLSLIVWNAINTSIIPKLFNDIKQDRFQSSDSLVKFITALFGAIAIVFTLLAPEIIYFFTTPEYYDAVYLMPALSAGIYLTAIYNIYGNYLLYRKKTINIMIATVFAAFSNLVMNYVFIYKYGYVAAAYTTFASFVVLAIVQGVMVRIEYKKRVVSDRTLLKISSVVCLLCIATNALYKVILLRYFFVFLFIIILFKKRKTIWATLKR